jgi:hypothetical protein
MELSRADMQRLCDALKAKALAEHDLMRAWQTRALVAEARLALYEPADTTANTNDGGSQDEQQQH